MSLKKQTFLGLFWAFGNTFIIKGLFFVATIVLARILGPSEFGLMGMISVFIAIGASLVDSGLSTSLIRTQNADDSDYTTVFYLNLGISFFLYLIFFFGAPFIADFYNQDILANIIRLYCLSFIITAFSSVQLTLLNKEMQFRKIMQYNIPGNIIGVITGIALGYLGYGVWSIVWMYLITQLVQSIILWSFSEWKPSKTFSKEKMKYHYAFGYKLTLSGLLDTVFKNSYNIIIGKYFSVQSLGYFERAQAFNDYSVSTLTGIISGVSYPLLAKLQNQKDKITEVYKKLLQFTFFITAPLMLGAAAIAKPLFLLVLGEQWLPAVSFFQILCLGGMFYPIHVFNISVLKVYGRSDLFLKLEIIKKIVFTISLLLAFQFGIYGLVWSSVFVSISALGINTHYSKMMINYTTRNQIEDMIPTLLKAGLMAGLMFVLVYLLKNESTYWQIVIPSFVGGLFYFLINYFLKATPLFFILNIIKERKL
ncbi:lipopolysaccharide biosynthesis protein [Flavobacterium sp.]|uniref:lipopolysaccharide biosynthesis protein n=1 Tax=Flavobacterium sp. TaxID=239 RepID=UPI002B4B770B|nr:lipopolysaccharide biosynthesis protein [Flavobacterium sp.]HLF51309.1 lipopolysaccharide biosynthesis protein [Flavobacterium sp.]